MALCYSRDGAARPLRVLEQFLREVREKIFNMDDTRSGRLRMTQSSGSDLHKTATENVIDIFEVFHRCNPLLKCWESRWKWLITSKKSQPVTMQRQAVIRRVTSTRRSGQSVLQGHPGARWNLLAPTCKVKDIAFDEVWKLTGLLYGRATISSYKIAEGAMLLIHLSAVSALVQSKTETEWQNGEASFRFQRILLLRGVCIPGNRCRFQLWCHRCFSDPAYDKFQQVSGQGDVVILTQIYSVWNFNGIFGATWNSDLSVGNDSALRNDEREDQGSWHMNL